MAQVGDVHILFCAMQHRGGGRQDEVVHVGEQGEVTGTTGAGFPVGQFTDERAVVAQLGSAIREP